MGGTCGGARAWSPQECQTVGNSLALEADLVLVALDSFGPLLMEVVQKAVFFCQ